MEDLINQTLLKDMEGKIYALKELKAKGDIFSILALLVKFKEDGKIMSAKINKMKQLEKDEINNLTNELKKVKKEAEEAKEEADEAKKKLENAKQDAENAQQEAENAQQDAKNAQKEAEDVQQQVVTKKEKKIAEKLQKKAEKLRKKAEKAKKKAETETTDSEEESSNTSDKKATDKEATETTRLEEEKATETTDIVEESSDKSDSEDDDEEDDDENDDEDDESDDSEQEDATKAETPPAIISKEDIEKFNKNVKKEQKSNIKRLESLKKELLVGENDVIVVEVVKAFNKAAKTSLQMMKDALKNIKDARKKSKKSKKYKKKSKKENVGGGFSNNNDFNKFMKPDNKIIEMAKSFETIASQMKNKEMRKNLLNKTKEIEKNYLNSLAKQRKKFIEYTKKQEAERKQKIKKEFDAKLDEVVGYDEEDDEDDEDDEEDDDEDNDDNMIYEIIKKNLDTIIDEIDNTYYKGKFKKMMDKDKFFSKKNVLWILSFSGTITFNKNVLTTTEKMKRNESIILKFKTNFEIILELLYCLYICFFLNSNKVWIQKFEKKNMNEEKINFIKDKIWNLDKLNDKILKKLFKVVFPDKEWKLSSKLKSKDFNIIFNACKFVTENINVVKNYINLSNEAGEKQLLLTLLTNEQNKEDEGEEIKVVGKVKEEEEQNEVIEEQNKYKKY